MGFQKSPGGAGVRVALLARGVLWLGLVSFVTAAGTQTGFHSAGPSALLLSVGPALTALLHVSLSLPPSCSGVHSSFQLSVPLLLGRLFFGCQKCLTSFDGILPLASEEEWSLPLPTLFMPCFLLINVVQFGDHHFTEIPDFQIQLLLVCIVSLLQPSTRLTRPSRNSSSSDLSDIAYLRFSQITTPPFLSSFQDCDYFPYINFSPCLSTTWLLPSPQRYHTKAGLLSSTLLLFVSAGARKSKVEQSYPENEIIYVAYLVGCQLLKVLNC